MKVIVIEGYNVSYDDADSSSVYGIYDYEKYKNKILKRIKVEGVDEYFWGYYEDGDFREDFFNEEDYEEYDYFKAHIDEVKQ